MRILTKIPGWVIAVAVGTLALIGFGAIALQSNTTRTPRRQKKKARVRKGAPRRRVFFSFHYQRDIWRVNQIRNVDVVDAAAAAGWSDASLWEEAKKKGDAAIKRLIDVGLEGTTVTAVLIGSETARRKYVNYEIEKSLERGNALIGIRIHSLPDQGGRTTAAGDIPEALERAKALIYDWDRDQFGASVQRAYRRASNRRLLEGKSR